MKQTKLFTLVELLTVIFVIGVLAGMIIPVTGIVRATAKRAACASNLRQVGVLAHQFSNERNGRILPLVSNSAYPLRKRRLEKAARDSNMTYYGVDNAKGDNYTTMGAAFAAVKTHWVAGLVRYARYDLSVFYCPADERSLDLFKPNGSKVQDIQGSYGLTFGGEVDDEPICAGGTDAGEGMTVEKVQRSPAVVFYIGESAQGKIGLDTTDIEKVVPDQDTDPAPAEKHNPHSEDYNMGFLDGHVETLSREKYYEFLVKGYHKIKG